MSIAATAINVVLGIFNACMLIRSRRVTLMIAPTIPVDGSGLAENPDTYEIRIQVINLSQFPVYVSEVGLQPRDSYENVLKFMPPGDNRFPILMNGREAIRFVTAKNDDMRVGTDRFAYAYAKTACGRTRRGTSPSLQMQEQRFCEPPRCSQKECDRLKWRHRLESLRYGNWTVLP
jgi:hypothetical protein